MYDLKCKIRILWDFSLTFKFFFKTLVVSMNNILLPLFNCMKFFLCIKRSCNTIKDSDNRICKLRDMTSVAEQKKKCVEQWNSHWPIYKCILYSEYTCIHIIQKWMVCITWAAKKLMKICNSFFPIVSWCAFHIWNMRFSVYLPSFPSQFRFTAHIENILKFIFFNTDHLALAPLGFWYVYPKRI